MKRAVISFFLIFFITNCAFAKSSVVTTTFILSSIVKQVGGRYVDVSYLVPSASNPHIFSPKPRSLIKLANADLFIGVGYGFEFWINSVKSFLNPDKIMLLSNYYKNPLDRVVVGNNVIANPHIWLDLRFMGDVAVYKIADKLCLLDKEHCAYFRKNALKLHNDIDSIRKKYIQTLSGLKNVCFLDIKPAFEYLLRSVNLHSCCVLVKKGNEEPGIGDIKEAIEKCTCRKGLVLYISDIQLATMMADKLKFRLVNLNPLGDPNNLNTYTKLLLYNLKQLQKAVE